MHHKDIVTGLAFREGTHELFSGSFDRTVKIWCGSGSFSLVGVSS